MSGPLPRLLIVYNAEAGIAAGIRDSIHKLLSPDTYPCGLCALTHGSVRMDPAWRRFIDSVGIEVRVYHRPDFRARHPELDAPLPMVALEHGRDVTPLIGAAELAGIGEVDGLIARITERLP